MNMYNFQEMTDQELLELSLQKDRKGCATYDAILAYEERRRRRGHIHYAGVSNRCNKWQNDYDYYGRYDI